MRSRSVLQQLLPVVVGALIGIVPVITSSYLQSRAAMRQMMFERRLAAVKGFSLACNRRLMTVVSTVSLMDALYAASKDQTPTRLTVTDQEGISTIFRQLESSRKEGEDALVALRPEADFANALFGANVQVSANPEMPVRLPALTANMAERLNDIIESGRRVASTLAEECRTGTALLNSKTAF